MGFSDIMSTVGDDLNGLLGNTAKAVLIFPDVPPEEANKEEVAGNMPALGASLTNVISAVEEVSDLRSKLAGLGIDSKKFTIQFNPSSLRISANGGGLRKVVDFSKTDSVGAGIAFTSLDPYINVSFDMIFDNTNNADAFMADKFVLSATTTTKNVATGIANAITGNEYTVRPQVEGFLAALRNEMHRVVIFQWGGMRYTGMMNDIQCRYTMFNTAGNPIRAVVGLNIFVGSTAQVNHLEYWKKRYKKALDDLTHQSTVTDENGNEIKARSGSANNNVFSNLYHAVKG